MRSLAGGLAIGCLFVSLVDAQAPRTMVEELRIGGADDGPASLARVFTVAAAPNGNIFVVDGPPIQLKLFDANGKFLRNVGRSGGGPGEYTFVSALLAGPDGNVHVIDVYGMRQLVFGADGELVRQRRIPFSSLTRQWVGTIAPDGGLLDPVRMVPSGGGPVSSGEPRATGIRHIRADGTVTDTVAIPDCGFRSARPRSIVFGREGRVGMVGMVGMVLYMPFLPMPRTVLSSDGHAWCSPMDEHLAVRFRARSSDTLSMVRKSVRAPRIPEDALRKTIESIRATERNYGPSNYRDGDLPSTWPVIAAIAVDDQSRLWIRRTDTSAREPGFDLFDPSGREQGTVTSRVPWEGIPIVVGDVAYGIVRDADDVPYVVRARIRWRQTVVHGPTAPAPPSPAPPDNSARYPPERWPGAPAPAASRGGSPHNDPASPSPSRTTPPPAP